MTTTPIIDKGRDEAHAYVNGDPPRESTPTVDLAAEAFLTTWLTENPEKLNEAPFGPYSGSDGDVLFLEPAGLDVVERAVETLYGGYGIESKKKFLDRSIELSEARGAFGQVPTLARLQREEYERIYLLSDYPEIDLILPLREQGAQGPPPPESAAITSDEFGVYSTLLAEIRQFGYGRDRQLFGTDAFGSRGPNYSEMVITEDTVIVPGRPSITRADAWIAIAKPAPQEVIGFFSSTTKYPLKPVPGFTSSFENLPEIQSYAFLKNIPSLGFDNLNEDFKDDNVLFMKLETPFNSSQMSFLFEEFVERIARNHPDALKRVADKVAKEVWADILEQEAARAERDPDSPSLVRRETPTQLNITPTDFQCVLLENVASLSATHNPNYKHIVPVDTNSQPATVMNTINYKKNVDPFLNICPDVYSLLTPYLRISRVEYDEKGKLIPGSQKDIDIPNFLSKTDVQNITAGRLGRAPGVGVKSFSWSLDGVQPAEVDNNISANLVIYFQTVNDFFREARAAGQPTPNFLDLIINSRGAARFRDDERELETPNNVCTVGNQLHRKYDGVDFRIKVCAGWSTPDNFTTLLPHYKGDIDKLKLALDESRTSFFLQQTRHDLNFAENGSVELSIDYQASLSGLLRAPASDILSSTITSENAAEIETLEARVEELEEKERLTEDQKKELKETLERIIQLEGQDRLIRYKRFLRNLYADDKVYQLAVEAKELLLTPYADLDPRERAARAKRRKSKSLTVLRGNQAIQTEVLDHVAAAAATGDTTPDEAADAAQAQLDERFRCIDTDPPDIVFIPYIYLGDLIDSVLAQIEENNDGEKIDFNMFLSEVEMIDPLTALQIKNLDEIMACGQLRDMRFLNALTRLEPTTFTDINNITQLMNIGDIPLSLDAFQVWFKENVVKKDIDKYFLLDFIKDISASLVTDALKSDCFGPKLNFSQRFDALPLTLSRAFAPGELVNSNTIAAARQEVTCEEAANTRLGLIMVSTDSRPKNLTGKYSQDVARGIYHHYVGSACGLVKSINFQREDQPLLREVKIQKNGELGAEQLRELYSANLELVGNNLYVNGAYTYISPLLFDASERELDLLGIHGYYMITSVGSVLTPNSFETSVRALHQGIRFDQAELLRPLSYDDLQPEQEPENWWSTDRGPTSRPARPGASPPAHRPIPSTTTDPDPDFRVVEEEHPDSSWRGVPFPVPVSAPLDFSQGGDIVIEDDGDGSGSIVIYGPFQGSGIVIEDDDLTSGGY